MSTTVVRNLYPTLVTVNGVTSEISLEELSLIAMENYVNNGNFDRVKELSVMIPIGARIIGTKEVFLEQYKNDFILVEQNLVTGEFLFGPINEKTVMLALQEVHNGSPVYRAVKFGDLNIINDEVLDMLDGVVKILPNATGEFTVRHTVQRGSGQNQSVGTVIEEHTMASLLYLLRQASHKSLAYYEVFLPSGKKSSTVETALKNFKDDDNTSEFVIDVVSAKNIKELNNSTVVMTVTGSCNDLSNIFDTHIESMIESKPKGEKLYVTNIREKDCSLSDFISKKELHAIKQVFDKLPQRIIFAVSSLTELYN